ncbi:MAG: DNA adenine methylase [Calditrichaeota bacterium]|nr:DNA adenine methylase [Calditrichota bacterium]
MESLQLTLPPLDLTGSLRREVPNKSTAPDHTFSSVRERFLRSLASSGKNPYKRYLGSPLRYAGGKSLAVGLIVERLPANVKRIVSPFIGGGSVEVACAVELGLEVVGYDIFDILCNYWQIQIAQPEALYRRLTGFKADRATFAQQKERLRQHWKEGKTLDPLELAAVFFFTFSTSYGHQFLSWPSSVYMDNDRYAKITRKVQLFRAPSMKIEASSFETVMPSHRDDFLYCDPPYYLDDGKMFCGMYPQRNFPIHHNNFKHGLLRDLLMEHRGGFILSYNDCTTIRKWYRDFEMITPRWQYTFGQGETRIGGNRVRANNGQYVKESHELLIWKDPK